MTDLKEVFSLYKKHAYLIVVIIFITAITIFLTTPILSKIYSHNQLVIKIFLVPLPLDFPAYKGSSVPLFLKSPKYKEETSMYLYTKLALQPYISSELMSLWNDFQDKSLFSALIAEKYGISYLDLQTQISEYIAGYDISPFFKIVIVMKSKNVELLQKVAEAVQNYFKEEERIKRIKEYINALKEYIYVKYQPLLESNLINKTFYDLVMDFYLNTDYMFKVSSAISFQEFNKKLYILSLIGIMLFLVIILPPVVENFKK